MKPLLTTPANPRRRALIKGAGAASALAAATPALAALPADPWAHADQIRARFAKPLVFPKRDFPITAHGAKPCRMVTVQAYLDSDQGVKTDVQTPAPGAPDAYPAIAAAIATASKAGGGRVLIPAGHWLCKGPIVLLSNVHVHLAKGAQVHFSANPADYARHGEFDCGANGRLSLSRWQGNDCLNYTPMVYARNQRNIAITGEDWSSVLNGQGGVTFEDGSGEHWWAWSGKTAVNAHARQGVTNPRNPESLADLAPGIKAEDLARIASAPNWRSDEKFLPALSEARVPVEKRVFGKGHYLRPCMIEFIGCTDVLMQGYQVVATPFWIHHPVDCRKLQLSRVRMESMGPNSDGFDPESCDIVLMDGCTFNTGDDCIAIKAGKANDTQYGPTRNVVLQDSIMNSGHGAITLGSEMGGGIEHVYAERLDVRNMHYKTDPLGTAVRLKTNMARGGFLRHFYVRDLTLPNGVKLKPGFYKPMPGSPVPAQLAATGGGAVITFDCDYAAAFDTIRNRPPQVSDVHISRIKVADVATSGGAFSCYQAFVVMGPVAHSYNGSENKPVHAITNISISDCDFGTPINGDKPWYAYNVQGLKLRNVRIGGKRFDTDITA
ncbi:glycoside hydrolase family 28 protein [Massilia yuzhufengensis]|uniref:Polygalacturonase n=1 Tax=Massilia yuzhufengensis TaxID=1164594 RepID=A0A1I1MYK3_9BURK|nr:glycoside hydrolase family 28 protein [Massilia yuzhufengensis]SFC90534.1 Polygalacturonase [Massilia yuzhufengensis]